MFKMEIAIDGQRVLQDGRYSPDDVLASIDTVFEHYRIQKHSDGMYVGGTWEDHGAAVMYLSDKPWFMPYVYVWKWYKSRLGNDDRFVVEDLAAHYKRKPAHKI